MLTKPSRFLRTRLFSIDVAEVTCQRRGFAVASPELCEHLEQVGRSFLTGYHEAISESSPEAFDHSSIRSAPEYSGFAYEGAAMAYFLLDSLSPIKRDRWRRFVDGPGKLHPYVCHVGVGWALARLPWHRRAPERALKKLDPWLRWLVMDGLGFHEGYFHCERWIRNPLVRPRFSAVGNCVFDQGLGRSIWFVECADVCKVSEAIRNFELERHGDLWSGIGLACAYAGTLSREELHSLMNRAGERLACLQQGVSFGAEARVHGGIANEYTQLVCETVCGMSAVAAAELTWDARKGIDPARAGDSVYQRWRRNTRDYFQQKEQVCVMK